MSYLVGCDGATRSKPQPEIREEEFATMTEAAQWLLELFEDGYCGGIPSLCNTETMEQYRVVLRNRSEDADDAIDASEPATSMGGYAILEFVQTFKQLSLKSPDGIFAKRFSVEIAVLKEINAKNFDVCK